MQKDWTQVPNTLPLQCHTMPVNIYYSYSTISTYTWWNTNKSFVLNAVILCKYRIISIRDDGVQ